VRCVDLVGSHIELLKHSGIVTVNHISHSRLLLILLNIYSGVRVRVRERVRVRVRVLVLVRVLVQVLLCRLEPNKSIIICR
jgi:hypothetical protein